MFFTETLESKETKISHLQRRRRRRAGHTWWNKTLSKTVKNQTGYIWRLVMPQQNVHILFMEADSGMGQWANELLKYTRPNPAALGAPWKRKKLHTDTKLLQNGSSSVRKLLKQDIRSVGVFAGSGTQSVTIWIYGLEVLGIQRFVSLNSET